MTFSGLEIWDESGNLMKINTEQVSVTPENFSFEDSRTVYNLFNGSNWTTDDLHSWVHPIKDVSILYGET